MSLVDRLRGKDSALFVPTPDWSERLPSKELDKIKSVVESKNFDVAYHGIEFKGRPIDELAVAQIALTLANISEEFVQAKGVVGFFRYGDNKRQIILPIRRSNIDPSAALNVLNNIIRQSTHELEAQGFPVVKFLPFSLNPFTPKQLGER